MRHLISLTEDQIDKLAEDLGQLSYCTSLTADINGEDCLSKLFPDCKGCIKEKLMALEIDPSSFVQKSITIDTEE